VGIGGIGMSALARYFNQLGIEVHGYDKTATNLTRTLEEEGMQIHYEDAVRYVPQQLDLVVYTPAIPDDHQELTYLRTQAIPLKKRAEVLGWISQNRRTIAIAGTHGKTTTSSILTHLLKVGGIDCTAFLGGIAQNYGGNFVGGQAEWVVVEADEYDRSFLHLHPEIALILSMDADHLDIYGDGVHMVEGFQAFARQLKTNGRLYVNHAWEKQVEALNLSHQTYGLEQGLYRATNTRVEAGYFVFDYQSPTERMEALRFTLPGRHNIENAVAAMAIAQQLGVKASAVRTALASFKGIKRRFEMIYRDDQRVYIDDYAHHPSELKAAIAAAKMLYPKQKITGIFQPHLYSRTRDFMEGFAAELDQLDHLLLLDIYPAREVPIPGITSEVILDKMKNPNRQLIEKAAVLDWIETQQPEVLLTLGAGDIDQLVHPIKTLFDHV
ncbi:MAG: UDP-N-acetylmuramate--L-alanine ligase, partial [Bacteroidota bacterium]